MPFQKGYTPWNKKEIKQEIVRCGCGCNQDMELYDNRGRARKFIHKHGYNNGKKFPGLKHDKQFQKGHTPFNKGEKGYNNKGTYKIGHPGLKGDKNPLWRGGSSYVGQGFRRKPEYEKWRLSVFERDNYTCKLCGNRGGKLIADHYPYSFSKHPERRLDINNGRTLCENCNYQVTYITKEWQNS